ncbi:hypothetical protein [Mesoplasma photuris]|uniref:hypothetical protein n=1 Tax=Mesoplasma photuris TaxID=217731 RepID=UPI00068B5CC3|nr:hypothetical protein [Mesoplasma photuris]
MNIRLNKKEDKEIRKHNQKKWQFNHTFKTANSIIMICGAIGMIAAAVCFIMGIAWIVVGAQEATVGNFNTNWGIVMTTIGGYSFSLSLLSLALSVTMLANKNTKEKTILMIVAIASITCMVGGIIMIFIPESDSKIVNAIKETKEVVEIENSDPEKTSGIYKAKYNKAVEMLKGIEAGELDEEQLMSRFSDDFKVIFLKAKKDLTVETLLNDEDYDVEEKIKNTKQSKEDLEFAEMTIVEKTNTKTK